MKKEKNEANLTLLEEYNTIDYTTLENYSPIGGYHHQSNAWRQIENGYGVELELHNDDYDIQDKLSRYLNYKLKMNIEEDGSLDDGSSYPMEIISQPYTQKEWQENKEKIYEFFELINDLGLWEDSTTGLHVHISKKLIGRNEETRENNINKLILILENYKSEFKKFARREDMYYCNFYSNKNGNGKAFKDLFTIQEKKEYSHYSALCRDDKTYELRIFNSTTNANTFIATLQLVFNLVEIIQRDDLTDLTFNDIINYNKDYEELISYCKEMKISNNTKIIDKTQVVRLLQLKENTKILRKNYKYNEYIDKVRQLILNNMELYNKDKNDYLNESDLYNDLNYIFTQTYRKNNSIYYTTREINNLLSNYSCERIYIRDNKGNVIESKDKRVFNKIYGTDYSVKLNKLIELIESKGGVI